MYYVFALLQMDHAMQLFVTKLIEFGAVYYCPVHPEPPARVGMSEADKQRVQAVREVGMARHGNNVRTV
jgi:hypothetical protein